MRIFDLLEKQLSFAPENSEMSVEAINQKLSEAEEQAGEDDDSITAAEAAEMMASFDDYYEEMPSEENVDKSNIISTDTANAPDNSSSFQFIEQADSASTEIGADKAEDVMEAIKIAFSAPENINDAYEDANAILARINNPLLRKQVLEFIESQRNGNEGVSNPVSDNLNKNLDTTLGVKEETSDEILEIIKRKEDVTDDQLRKLKYKDLFSIEGFNTNDPIFQRKRALEKKGEVSAENVEPAVEINNKNPDEWANEYIRGMKVMEGGEGLTRKDFELMKKDALKNTSTLPAPARKAYERALEHRINKAGLRAELVGKEVQLANAEKSMAEFTKNIARLKRFWNLSKYALLGAAMAGGMLLGAGSAIGGIAAIGGAGGGLLANKLFSKDTRKLNVEIAKAERTILMADYKIEDVKEQKNKGDLSDIEAFMKSAAYVAANEFGVSSKVMQDALTKRFDIGGLNSALGYTK